MVHVYMICIPEWEGNIEKWSEGIMIYKINTNTYQTIMSDMKIEFILITFCYMNMLYGRLYTHMRM
jgi:uncharacterized protein involved in tolerance to divalent cations